jgi:hypothetical protein
MSKDKSEDKVDSGWTSDTNKSGWVHDHNLSVGKMKEQLLFCKTLIEGAIAKQKEELQKLTNLRDSFK